MENEIAKLAIENLQKQMDKLDKTMSEGFTAIYSKLDIMSDHYVKRDELERTEARIKDWADERVKDVEKTANLNQKIIFSAIGMILVAFMGYLIFLSFKPTSNGSYINYSQVEEPRS